MIQSGQIKYWNHYPSSLTSTFLPRRFYMIRMINHKAEQIRNVREIGWVNKMLKSPLDVVKARRKLFSIIGPSTSPRTNGANGKSFSAKKYPKRY